MPRLNLQASTTHYDSSNVDLSSPSSSDDDTPAPCVKRYKTNNDVLKKSFENAKLLWIIDPNTTDLYSEAGTECLSNECKEWIKNQVDTLSTDDPKPQVFHNNRNPPCYSVLAWMLSSAVETLEISSSKMFWEAVNEYQDNQYKYPTTSLLPGYDLIILPSHRTMPTTMTMNDAKKYLSFLTTSSGCAFLPGIHEFFELADKFAIHSRLQWKLPMEFNVGPSKNQVTVKVYKLPSIKIINHQDNVFSDEIVQKLKDELDGLLQADELMDLQSLLGRQSTKGYVLKARYGGCGVDVHIMQDNELTAANLNIILTKNQLCDFFLEPYLHGLKNLEHRVYISGIEGTDKPWLVDTSTSIPGDLTSSLMRVDQITSMVYVSGNKITYHISRNELRVKALFNVAKKVKEIIICGRGLLFNCAQRLLMRVDMHVDFDDRNNKYVAVVNEIDQFNSAHLLFHENEERRNAEQLIHNLSVKLNAHVKICCAEKFDKINTRKTQKGT